MQPPRGARGRCPGAGANRGPSRDCCRPRSRKRRSKHAESRVPNDCSGGSAPGIRVRRASAPCVSAATDTVVVQWNEALLQAVGNTRAAPTVTARALAMAHTCMFDAWAAYDPVADGVHWPVDLRQPAGEHTQANKDEAISFAAHGALVDLFPAQASLFDAQLAALGYSAARMAGTIGLEACLAVLHDRHGDGANQLGDLHPGRYSDYTGYAPVNTVDISTIRTAGSRSDLVGTAGVPDSSLGARAPLRADLT